MIKVMSFNTKELFCKTYWKNISKNISLDSAQGRYEFAEFNDYLMKIVEPVSYIDMQKLGIANDLA